MISSNWEEATLNWDKKPSPYQEITSFWISSFSWDLGSPPIFYIIDVIEVIQFIDDNDYILSICINTILDDPDRHGYMTIASKELHNNNTFFGPLLHISYIHIPDEEQPVNGIPILPIIIGISATIGIVAVLGVGYFYIKKERQKRNYISTST